MIKKIFFNNYKSFKEPQELELKPITILFGKNSSGKSAIAKLPTLIENSLSGKFPEPLIYINDGVELGAEFKDLVYGRAAIGYLELGLQSEVAKLTVRIASGIMENDFPKIVTWKLNEEFDLTYNDLNNNYINHIDDQSYLCEFNGFNLDNLFYKDKDGSGDVPSLKKNKIELQSNYIGPFRITPPRTFVLKSKKASSKIGIKGENSYQILASDALNNNGVLLNKVSRWYEENFAGWGLDVNTNAPPDYKIELTRKSPKFNINIADVGEGMSQALPLIVSALTPNNMLTIIEQPELHLHPAAHGDLAQLFAESTKQSNKRYLIETHSQNFILRLRRLVAEGQFDKDNIAIYWVNYDEGNNTSALIKINLTQSGEVDFWPKNIFSETLDETIAIRTAQLKKEE